MQKYIGTYRVFHAIDLNAGRASSNDNDTYLKGKYNTEIYRYDDDTLAIYFVATNTVNNVLPKLQELGVHLTKYLEGDSESIYLFPEKDIHKVHTILKFQTKGKNIQSKSIKTARKQLKNNKKI